MAAITLTDLDNLSEKLALKMGSNAENLSSEGFEVAAQSANLELGWEFPCSHPKKVLWYMNRGLRYCIEILMIESAHKFRYDKIFLQNRFAHYEAILKKMDSDFEKAQEVDPSIFATVSVLDENYVLNGMIRYIPNVRDYDSYGRE